MAELPEDDYRLTKGLNNLLDRLRVQMERGTPSWDQLLYIAYNHRMDFKRETGYDFPRVSPFYLPSVRFAAFFLSDRDEQSAGLQVHIVLRDLATKGFTVSALEVAAAVRKCWPHIKHLAVEDKRKDPKLVGQLH